MCVCIFFPKHLKVSLILISDVQNYGIAIRDWSLITGRVGGGLQNGRGMVNMKFYPYKKGGGRKKF